MERKSERRSGQRPSLVLKTTENAILMKSTQELTIEEAHEEALKENSIRNLSALESDIKDITDPYYAIFADQVPTPEEERQGKRIGVLPFLGKTGTKTDTFYHDPTTNLSYSYRLEYQRSEDKNVLTKVDLFPSTKPTKQPMLSLSFQDRQMTDLTLNNIRETTKNKQVKSILDELAKDYTSQKTLPPSNIKLSFPENLYITYTDGTPITGSLVSYRNFKYDAADNTFNHYGKHSKTKEKILDITSGILSLIPTLDLNEKK